MQAAKRDSGNAWNPQRRASLAECCVNFVASRRFLFIEAAQETTCEGQRTLPGALMAGPGLRRHGTGSALVNGTDDASLGCPGDNIYKTDCYAFYSTMPSARGPLGRHSARPPPPPPLPAASFLSAASRAPAHPIAPAPTPVVCIYVFLLVSSCVRPQGKRHDNYRGGRLTDRGRLRVI